MKYNIQLKVYEGPMDLLYDLVTKHKIDIKDISISEITEQYIKYISEMEKMDMEVTSDFIAMASKLLEIKSRYLLYLQRDDRVEEDDPRLELVEKLEEYRKYKHASFQLREKCSKVCERFYRKKEEITTDDTIDKADISIEMMMKFLPKLLKNAENKEEKIKSDDVDRIVKRKIVSVEEKMVYIRDVLKERNKVKFTETVKENTKDEIIASFLSILELIKQREITVEQDRFFEDIIISRNMEY